MSAPRKPRRARPVAEMAVDLAQYPRSAIRSYCEMELAGGARMSDVSAILNEALGRSDRLNRLYEWLAGSVHVPDDVRRYCARASVGYVLRRAAGIDQLALTDEQLDEIADSLI